MPTSHQARRSVVGLFAGIGGIEAGLSASDFEATLLCEIDTSAGEVLEKRFPQTSIHTDVTTLSELPDCDLLTAGFPCQDLSQAGRTAGIGGSQSRLVEHVFRLLDQARPGPQWLLLENVSFMLSLDRGRAMTWLVERLEERGYTWAYRVVDTLAFGLPQRRQRVLLLASRVSDPRPVLLNQIDAPDLPHAHEGILGCGFYWTEGQRGLGWAVDAVPTLKGGSALGIPSPPAIWNPTTGAIVTPDIRDAERMQGFPADWTAPAKSVNGRGQGHRWKLVGNAVSVPVAEWLGQRLGESESYDETSDVGLDGERWPRAAWGRRGKRRLVESSMWPVRWKRSHLLDYLRYEPRPLSARAAAGFLERTERGSLNIDDKFLCDVRRHLESMIGQQSLLAA